MERNLFLVKMDHRKKVLRDALARNSASNRMLVLVLAVGDTPRCISEAYYADRVEPNTLPPHAYECRCVITPMSERAFLNDPKLVKKYGLPK